MLSTIALDTKVIRANLCTGCGACQGLCPYWGTDGHGRTIRWADCERHEGRCVSFCPAMPTDRAALAEKFFDKDTMTAELGPFRALYLTRAADETVRAGAQHGGTMTALLLLALKEGFIDGAVLTRSKGGLGAEGVFAANEAEIRACMGSSFQIAPALAVLNETLKTEKYHKIGVVGTPCKTLAVYKMKAKPLADNDNRADDIGMVFGLFCGWGLDWDGVDALARETADAAGLTHMDIPPSKYHCMEFTSGGETKSVSLDRVEPLVRPSCRACTDMTAEFADVSVGGARSAAGWEVDKGWNQVIVRSAAGEELMRRARETGVLEFKDVPDGNVEKLKRASMGKKNK